MDKALLVASDLTIGEELVKALEKSPLSINVAMWLYSPDYEDWRFVLSSPRLNAARPESYGLVHDAFTAAGITLKRTPTLWIMNMSDPFIRELRRTFAKTKDVEGMRLGGHSIGGRFVEDAIVYRIR